MNNFDPHMINLAGAAVGAAVGLVAFIGFLTTSHNTSPAFAVSSLHSGISSSLPPADPSHTRSLSSTYYSNHPEDVGGILSQSRHLIPYAKLLEANQDHLFEDWDGQNTEDIDAFFAQIKRLDENYPGGIEQYVKQAQKLLELSRDGHNPFADFTPEVPTGSKLEFNSPQYEQMEAVGLAAAGDLAFVLVAGGLGERLGFSGIKVALPSEITTEKCYLHVYCESILALQAEVKREAGTDVQIPLVIMTSDDTHNRTSDLLQENKNFGMSEGQITLLKQEKVASIIDNDGRLARDPNNIYNVLTKPHGHGDVHYLLHSTGIAQKWLEEGRKWVFFFQDTNGLVFRPLMATLGVAVNDDYAAMSVTGARKAKEAMGAICKLKRSDGTSITTNVEYNQLEPMLLASGFPDGDVNDESGFSPFPGNMNQLLFRLDTYVDTLQKTKGMVPEFVNPKYKDSTRTTFKKPTRLECMMQDLPQMFGGNAKVGFTTVTGTGLEAEQLQSLDKQLKGKPDGELIKQCFHEHIKFYSPVKNNIQDASTKQREQGVAPACAASGEADLYGTNSKVLVSLGVAVTPPRLQIWGSEEKGDEIRIMEWPHIVLSPQCSMTTSMVRRCFPQPEQVSVGAGSSLVLDGPGLIIVESLDLKGSLYVYAAADTVLRLQLGSVKNAGQSFLKLEDENQPEYLRIRGYRLQNFHTARVERTSPGEVVASEVDPTPKHSL